MKLYDKMYGGMQCRFLGNIFSVVKIEGEKIFIGSSLDNNFIYSHQLEHFTKKEIQEMIDDDDLPRMIPT
jgi:hypothetical protein